VLFLSRFKITKWPYCLCVLDSKGVSS
jgi:hypothetical protein